MIAPFPWSELPKVDPRSSRVAAAAAALLGSLRPAFDVDRRGGELVVRRTTVQLLGAEVVAASALAERLGDPSAGVARLRAGAWRAFVVAPGRLVRRLSQELFGGPDELAAPRPLTLAERAVLVAAVADALDERGVAVEVELCELGAPQLAAALGGDAALIELGTERGPVTVVVPVGALLAPARRPLAALIAARPAWLDAPLVVPVVVAGTRLDRAAVAALQPRDVVVVTPAAGRLEAMLQIARGGLRAALDRGAGRVTVLAPYRRGAMDETLGDDATVDVAVAVGDVRLTLRGVLELVPGQVLALGRPLGSAVELRVGTRVVARGELVDVDGELGVRVLSLDAALSSDAPAC